MIRCRSGLHDTGTRRTLAGKSEARRSRPVNDRWDSTRLVFRSPGSPLSDQRQPATGPRYSRTRSGSGHVGIVSLPLATVIDGSRCGREGKLVLSDAADLASGQEIQTDVCIVGAGPAGISIAHELQGTDIGVWLLESGGREVERRAQRLNRGQSVGYPIHRL